MPNDPARVDTKNKWTVLQMLKSLINFSRSDAEVLPSRPNHNELLVLINNNRYLLSYYHKSYIAFDLN